MRALPGRGEGERPGPALLFDWASGRKGRAHIVRLGATSCGVTLMRDWVLVLTPIAVVVYFIVYPDQFHAFMMWIERLIN